MQYLRADASPRGELGPARPASIGASHLVGLAEVGQLVQRSHSWRSPPGVRRSSRASRRRLAGQFQRSGLVQQPWLLPPERDRRAGFDAVTCENAGRAPWWGRVTRAGAFGRRTTPMKFLVIGLHVPSPWRAGRGSSAGCSGGTYRPRLHRVLAATSRRAEVAAEPDRAGSPRQNNLPPPREQLLAGTAA